MKMPDGAKTVEQVLNMFDSDLDNFELRGAHSGRVYHKSLYNARRHLEQFLDWGVRGLYPTQDLTPPSYGTPHAIPVLGIWVRDYDYAQAKEKEKERSL